MPDVLKMNETIVFLDSGYLSYISKYFGRGKPLRYKIEKFASNLSLDKNLLCNGVYFYIAPPFQSPISTEEENKRKASYDKFINKLKQTKPEIIIREGRCQKIGDTFQQKGVDTLMTMDLLKITQKKEIKTIIILTADTDFVPIINEVKNSGLKVILAYFTDKKRRSPFSLSNHLWKICDDYILINKKHFEE